MCQSSQQAPHQRHSDHKQAYKKNAPHTIREIQIKTTTRYHYITIRMAKIQNTDNIECSQECGATRTHSFLAGMQNGIATLEQFCG